jgi:putative FmdB family regulatory protein
MSAAQQAACAKWFPGLRRPHAIILNRSSPDGAVRGRIMPIFEYICKECQHEFEALVFGKDKAECPKCQSKRLEPQLSVFAAVAKGGASSAPSAGPCGSCGDPRGPGACSLGDMD